MAHSQSARIETQSTASQGAQASVSSKSSLVLLQLQAKAEAAQTKAAFMKKEIDIKVEQARLQAVLESLRAEQELEVVRAEASALKAGLMELGFEIRSRASSPVRKETKEQLVAQYVLEQTNVNTGETPRQMNTVASPTTPHVVTDQPAATNPPAFDYSPLPPPPPITSRPLPVPSYRNLLDSASQTPITRAYDQDDRSSVHHTTDLAKFLARSRLITTGLTSFDDQPINYWAWKASFKSAIAGLDLSVGKELDLLVKYLGKDSALIRLICSAVNIRHPVAGLTFAWERLEETFGSPEAIEHALFMKIERFPKVNVKEPQKLRDLADLLSELEYAKLDGCLPGLSYLDTARGVHPIVQKLPYNIQEKWISYGSKYKREHRVNFPPFSVFVNFVRTEAKARTDPSFNLFASSFVAAPEKKDYVERSARIPVSVDNTQVSSAEKPPTENEKDPVNPGKQCPIHQKPHPLKKCRGFRQKELDERKELLKKYSICFRCCSSTEHLARNCTAVI